MSVECMPLSEMESYQGTNPRPVDFDAFWKKGLEQVKNHDAQAVLQPADYHAKNVKCYDLFFKGIDGARIHAKYLSPAAEEKVPVIFLFHGYTGDAGDWFDKLAWVQKGFAVAALDVRGQSGLSQDIGGVSGTTYLGHIVRGLLDEPEKLFYRQVYLDIALLVKTVSSFTEIDEEKMAAHGGSQGGALSLVCAALCPQIKKVAVLYPFLCDYKHVWDMDCTDSAYEELKLFFRAHDRRHEREEEFFTKLGYIDVQYLTPYIKADVLWATALRDQACPASTQFAAYNHLKCKKKHVLYPDFGHENLPEFLDECSQFLTF